MTGHNLDPFALARQGEGDAELFAAEREYAELQPKWTPLNDLPFDHPEVEALNAEESRINERINTTAPTTAAGALVKLRHFINSPTGGKGWFGVTEEEVVSLEQIAAFIEAQLHQTEGQP